MSVVDWTGQRFGMLVAIEPTDYRPGNKVFWKLRCDCGNEVLRNMSSLSYTTRKGAVASCGCKKSQLDKFVGQRFGMLTAVRAVETRGKKGNLWLFRCDCGNEVIRTGARIRYRAQEGYVSSCGCRKPNAKPYGVAAREDWLNRYIRGATERGIPWELTNEQAYGLFEQNCHYCGAEPSVGTTNRFNGTYAHNGIDRRDSSMGYTIENCVPCCSQCNFLKLSMPYEEFVAWLDRLVEFRFKSR